MYSKIVFWAMLKPMFPVPKSCPLPPDSAFRKISR